MYTRVKIMLSYIDNNQCVNLSSNVDEVVTITTVFLIIVKLLLLPSLIIFVIESSSRTGRKTLKQLYPLNDLSLVQGDSLDLCCNANIEQYAYHYYYRC